MCWQRFNLFWTTWRKFNILYTVVHAYLTWYNTMRDVKKKKKKHLKKPWTALFNQPTTFPANTWTWSKALLWMKVKQIGKHSCISDCFNRCLCNTAYLYSPIIKIKCKSTFLFCTSSQIFYTDIMLHFTCQCSISLEWNTVYYFRNSHNDQSKSGE